jgi:hypothetical protein
MIADIVSIIMLVLFSGISFTLGIILLFLIEAPYCCTHICGTTLNVGDCLPQSIGLVLFVTGLACLITAFVIKYVSGVGKK